MKNIIPYSCLALYLIVAVWSGFNPVERGTWVVEILTSAVPVAILVIMYIRWVRFSNLAYVLMTILPVMHAIGSHYTFALVPSQWLSDLLGTDRNMYDRVAHASVGLYAYGIAEYIDYHKLTSSVWLKLMFAVFAIMALACVYELFERAYAVMADPEAGIAILGSQWDIRDAQKDMLMDTIGALIAVVIYAVKSRISSKD
jgi:putative membrane protein